MATEKPDLTRVWASGAPEGNVVDPDTQIAGKVASGWVAEAPSFRHFNFLQNWFSGGLAYFNEQGIGEWDSATVYPQHGIVKGSDGKLYKSKSANAGNDPVSDDGTFWILGLEDDGVYNGEWNPGVTYNKGATVHKNGVQYVANFSSENKDPAQDVDNFWSVKPVLSEGVSGIAHPQASNDDSLKLLFPNGIDNGFFAVTKNKSANRYCFINFGRTVEITPGSSVIAQSNRRQQEAIIANSAHVGKFDIFSKTAGVTLAGLGGGVMDDVFGISSLNTVEMAYGSTKPSSEVGFKTVGLTTKDVHRIPQGDSVVYSVLHDCKLRIAATDGSSDDVGIYTSTDNINWTKRFSFNAKQAPAGQVVGYDVDIQGISNGTANYYIKVQNDTSVPADVVYVAGLNISSLDDLTTLNVDLDSAIVKRSSMEYKWCNGDGANEFAMSDTDGVFFGTYHGGHQITKEVLHTSVANYDFSVATLPAFQLTKKIDLTSISEIVCPSVTVATAPVYDYTAKTVVGMSECHTKFQVTHKSGDVLFPDRVYASMTTASTELDNQVESISGSLNFGNVSSVTQYTDTTSEVSYREIETTASQTDVSQSTRGGAFIISGAVNRKLYFSPIQDIGNGKAFFGGQWATRKRFV